MSKKRLEDLTLVNYCHPDCVPMQNIMRLGREDAFALAKKLAAAHPDTTAFGRFADFENYYALREAQDAWMYARFLELGGAHHLSIGGDLDGCDKLPTGFTGIQSWNDLGRWLMQQGVKEETVNNVFNNNAVYFALKHLQKTCVGG